jgi:Peptidase family M23
MQTALPLLIAFFDVLLPCVFLAWVWRSGAQTRVYLLSIALVVAAYLFAIESSILGYWHAISIYSPFVYFTIFVLIVIARLRHLPRRWFPARRSRECLLIGLNVVHVGVWVVVLVGTFRARRVEEGTLQLSAPLRSGTFMIIAGGGNLSVNPHTRAVKYALDITELNSTGRRARSVALFPTDLATYEIFGAEVIAPCSGEILAVENDEPDLTPPHPDYRGIGNFVAISCRAHTVRLLHLRAQSVRVAVGEVVKTGQWIANVGNSGNTLEPHLHIDAVAGRRVLNPRFDGGVESVPIAIDGRFLIKGDILAN